MKNHCGPKTRKFCEIIHKRYKIRQSNYNKKNLRQPFSLKTPNQSARQPRRTHPNHRKMKASQNRKSIHINLKQIFKIFKYKAPKGLKIGIAITFTTCSTILAISLLQSERLKNNLINELATEKIEEIAQSLESEALDWAIWDETDLHLKGYNPSYYKENFNQYSFRRTPFVAALNKDGLIISTAQWNDAENKITTLKADLIEEIQLLIPKTDPLRATTYLAELEGKPYLFTLQPVRKDNNSKKSSGRLLFARPLDAQKTLFNTGSPLNRALNVSTHYFGQVNRKDANLNDPIKITNNLSKYNLNNAMPLTIEREANEKRVTFMGIISMGIIAILSFYTAKYRSYTKEREIGLVKALSKRERMKINANLKRINNYDELTGSLSKQGLLREMKAQETHFPSFITAIMYIDLDNFQLINNSLGRDAGDKVIQHVSKELAKISHSSSLIARLDGDKYGLSLIGTSRESIRSEIFRISEQLNKLRLTVSGQTINLTTSIGASFVNPGKYENGIHEASIACSIKKLEGGHGHLFYGDSENTTVSYLTIQQLNQELIDAIHESRIEIYGQQGWQLDEEGLPATYIELLSRIRPSQNGNPYWDEKFIEAANSTGNLQLFDRSILQLACRSIGAFQQKDLNQEKPTSSRFVFAINITPDTLTAKEFSEELIRLVGLFGIDPTSLCIEITEQAALSKPNETIFTIKKLRRLGFKFALDDFGTGMTSLSQLKDIPLDYVKIDKNFIQKIHIDPSCKLITKFVVDLGKRIGFETIAEGVEDMETLLKLQEIGISIAQGYVITKPRPIITNAIEWNFKEGGRVALEEYKRLKTRNN